MAFLCPTRFRKGRRRHVKKDALPLPGRITGSASIDTLVRVGLEKEDLYYEGRPKVIILNDFIPCVDDELQVHRGQKVTLLYKENDWVYVISENGKEGFIPYVYCAALPTSNANDIQIHASRPASIRSSFRGGNTEKLPPQQLYGRLNRSTSTSLPSISNIRFDGSLDGSTHSDTPLMQTETPAEVVTFCKRPCGRSMVLFRFQALEENDISVDRGEFVTVLNREDPDWFWVQRTDRREGFVPSRYLCPADGQMSGTMSLTRKPARSSRPSVVNSNNNVSSSAPVTPTRNVNNNSSTGAMPARARTKLICLYDFTGRSPDDLPVMRGEWVYADMEDQLDPDWLWAYHPGTKRSGFLPRTYARPPGGSVANTAAAGPRRGSQDELSRRPRDPFLSP